MRAFILSPPDAGHIGTFSYYLAESGVEVVRSTVNDWAWNGQQPSLDDIDVVVHLGFSDTFTEPSLSSAGVAALDAFVRAGGGYVADGAIERRTNVTGSDRQRALVAGTYVSEIYFTTTATTGTFVREPIPHQSIFVGLGDSFVPPTHIRSMRISSSETRYYHPVSSPRFPAARPIAQYNGLSLAHAADVGLGRVASFAHSVEKMSSGDLRKLFHRAIRWAAGDSAGLAIDTPAFRVYGGQESPLVFAVNRPPNGIRTLSASTPSSGRLRTIDRTTTFTPAVGFVGSVTASVAIGDLAGGLLWTGPIEVVGPNAPPVIQGAALEVEAGGSVEFDVVVTDSTNDPFTFAVTRPPVLGTLTCLSLRCTYATPPGTGGSDSFEISAVDPGGLSGRGTFTVTVLPTNVPPIAIDDRVVTRGTRPVDIELRATDADGDALTFDVVAAPATGTLVRSGAVWTFTPGRPSPELVTFTFRAYDGRLWSNVATTTIEVLPATTITATPQALTTPEDVVLPITLAATDAAGRSMYYRLAGGPSEGQGTLSGDAPSLVYVPAANWSGAFAFSFEACVGAECSDPASVAVTVTPVNDPPVAEAVTAGTDEEVPVGVPLSGRDVEASPLTFELRDPPARGAVTIEGGVATYTPAADVSGQDAFTYVAFDGAAYSTPAVATVTIRDVNDPPAAIDRTLSAPAFASTPVTLSATDIDDDESLLTYEVTSAPLHGTLSGTPPSLTYTPEPGYTGADTLQFRARDPGGLYSPHGTITLQVGGGGQAPVATPASWLVDEDGQLSILLAGVDPEGGPLAFEVMSPPSRGSLSGTAPALTYRPFADLHGADALSFRVSDGTSWSAPAQVTLTVRPVNDAPVVRGPAELSVGEDASVEFDIHVTDVDDAFPSVVIDRLPLRGTLERVAGRATRLVYTPFPDVSGSDTFTVRGSDGRLSGMSYTVRVTILGEPDAPLATPRTYTTPEDTALDLVLAGTDPDGDPLTFRLERGPANGRLAGTPPVLRYLPNLDFHGTDSFAFTSHDGTARSQAATVTLTVTPVNDPPVVLPRTVSTPEDTPVVLSAALGAFAGRDPDGDTLTFVPGTPSQGTLAALAGGAYRYSPPPDFHGVVTLPLRASDGLVTSVPGVVTIEVAPVNDPPRLAAPGPGTAHVLPDGEVFELACVVTDPDAGDVHRFTATGLPAGATLGEADGRFRWTPTYEQAGAHAVTFRVTDRAGLGAEQVVAFTVTVQDRDGDGVPDAIERRWATDPTKPDSDGDGLPDLYEYASLTAPFDSDGDRLIDALDTDSDFDGVPDADERGPDGEPVDTDLDGRDDQRDDDSDDDGVADGADNCRLVKNPVQADTDGDGSGDACDEDRDGDGVSDAAERAVSSDPLRADTDGDTIRDGDEYGLDGRDTDRDRTPDLLDEDSDNDGVPDAIEAGDTDPRTPPVDSDADGTPDYRDLDSDNDGVPDLDDVCRLVTDPQQGDLDRDGQGDACDGDDDGDTVPDRADNCPHVRNTGQEDADEDGTGDACTADDDADGQEDAVDNCPGVANADQSDLDADGAGDACDEMYDATFAGGCAAGGAGWWWMVGWVVMRRRGRGKGTSPR